MARPSGLLQWHQTVSTYLPHLSQPQLTVLVLWSFGIVLAQTCGLTTVAATLAYVLGCSAMTLRERLRDWYRAARDKSGAKRGRQRRSLEVPLCFAPLLCWVVAWTDPTCRQLALAVVRSHPATLPLDTEAGQPCHVLRWLRHRGGPNGSGAAGGAGPDSGSPCDWSRPNSIPRRRGAPAAAPAAKPQRQGARSRHPRWRWREGCGSSPRSTPAPGRRQPCCLSLAPGGKGHSSVKKCHSGCASSRFAGHPWSGWKRRYAPCSSRGRCPKTRPHNAVRSSGPPPPRRWW